MPENRREQNGRASSARKIEKIGGRGGSRSTTLREDLVVFVGCEGTSWSAPSSSSKSLVSFTVSFVVVTNNICCLLFVVLCYEPGLPKFSGFVFVLLFLVVFCYRLSW